MHRQLLKPSIFMVCMAVVGLQTGCATSPAKSDEDNYEILLGEERRPLPSAVKQGLSQQNVDILEKNVVATVLPKSSMGFLVEYTVERTGRRTTSLVECHPLPSGHLRCAERVTELGRAAANVRQGVYALGGLLPLAVGYFVGEHDTVNTNPSFQFSERLRIDQRVRPTLDFKYDLNTPALGGVESPRTRCKVSHAPINMPQAIREIGAAAPFVCTHSETTLTNLRSAIAELDATVRRREGKQTREWEPGLPGGAMYFYSQRLGVALPAAIFPDAQIPAEINDSSGYFGLWQRFARSTADGTTRLTVSRFEWLKPDAAK